MSELAAVAAVLWPLAFMALTLATWDTARRYLVRQATPAQQLTELMAELRLSRNEMLRVSTEVAQHDERNSAALKSFINEMASLVRYAEGQRALAETKRVQSALGARR